MTSLQEKAIEMIHIFSDDDVSLLIEIMQRMSLNQSDGTGSISDAASADLSESEKMSAYNRLLLAQEKIISCLPEDFDPDRELRDARDEKYGRAG